MINLYAVHGTTNMGDFLNCLPVLSGIYNSYGKINLIIQNDMKRFNGFRDLLSYQEMFNSVKYESEINTLVDYLPFNSWIEDFSYDGINPIETSRYEKYFKLVHDLKFEVDCSFELKIPELNVGYRDIIVGDRCLNSASDNRRNVDVIKNSGQFIDVEYLDFSNSCIYNANIIKKCNSFITTFTGVAILTDLMGIAFDLYYESEFDGWANQSIELSYKKHFYVDRKSNLKLLGNI
jgi:hypothetical protein